VPINIEEIIERAFEQAFSKALEQSLQNKTEELFKTAFANGSPLAKKLEAKIEEGFQRFGEGIFFHRNSSKARYSVAGTSFFSPPFSPS
jgi:hypothetical protein